MVRRETKWQQEEDTVRRDRDSSRVQEGGREDRWRGARGVERREGRNNKGSGEKVPFNIPLPKDDWQSKNRFQRHA